MANYLIGLDFGTSQTKVCLLNKDSDVREFIKQHFEAGNNFDFMLRTKVPRSSKLVLEFEDGRILEQQRICRYYPCVSGGKLIKLMPALETNEDKSDRRLGIDTAWNVKTCNNMQDFEGDIDFEYYVQEAEKLVIGGSNG